MGRNQVIAIILILVVIVGASVALVFMTEPTRPPVDSYVYERGYDPDSLDPHNRWSSGEVIEQVYETLYTYPWGSGERGNHPKSTPTVPLLAASAPVITENGTVYTIPLRQGITFHDGTPFNASAAVWNFKRAMKIFDTYGPIEGIAETIKGGMQVKDAALRYGSTSDEFKAAFDAWEVTDAIEATGTYEITFRLEEAAAFFIPAMTSMVGCMISPTFAEKHATNPGDSFGVDYGEEFTYMLNHTCGTGPYRVVEWKKDNYVHMVLSEDYWRADATESAIAPPTYAGSINEIWLRVNQNYTNIKSNFRAGLIDDTGWSSWYADEIYDNVTMGSKDPNIFVRTGGVSPSVSGFSFQMGMMNWTVGGKTFEVYSPFHWRAFRTMMVYLMDYDAFNYARARGWVVTPQGPIPVGMPYHNSSYWTEHYDPETAVEYWNEAMQDPQFVDVMNAIKGSIFLRYFPYGDHVQAEVCLLLEDGFEAMKLLPEMNTTGIDYDVRIAAHDNWDFYEPFDLPMWPSWWGAEYADPHGFVSPLYSGSTYAMKQGYNNSLMDDLIMQGVAETDPAVRQQVYNQIQELAAYDRPTMWLYSYKEFTTFRAWLKGIGMRYNPMSSYYYIYHVYKDY